MKYQSCRYCQSFLHSTKKGFCLVHKTTKKPTEFCDEFEVWEEFKLAMQEEILDELTRLGQEMGDYD